MPKKLTTAELQNLNKAEIIQLNAELFPQYFAAIVNHGKDSNHARHWRNRIAEVNRKLVHREAKAMVEKTPEELQDLEQIGCLGLINAIELFDIGRGVKFSSYAIPFIRGEMSHYLRKHWGIRPRINRTDHDNYMLVVAAHKKALKTLPNANIDLIALNIEDKKGRKIFTADSWRELSDLMQGNAISELNEQVVATAPEQLAECLSILTGVSGRQCLTEQVLEVIIDVVIRQPADILLEDRLTATSKALNLPIEIVERRYKIGVNRVLEEYTRVLDNAI
jgi:RNA polymerase sigma factor (sigma-70 family)